jgi:hypothetical protein
MVRLCLVDTAGNRLDVDVLDVDVLDVDVLAIDLQLK